ncbi:MAG: TlpA disulfide reductase family protein [Myxococcaceae bacterium]
MSEPAPKSDRLTWTIVAVLLLGAIAIGWGEVNSEILPEGSPAPLFKLDTLYGPPVELSALKGKVVVVNFWATWCPPCREEMPYLIKVVQEHEADGVALVAVSNDDLDGQREAVSAFIAGLPQLKSYAALGRPEVGMVYKVEALPSVFVIDKQGRVFASHQGQASESQLRRWIKKALEVPAS